MRTALFSARAFSAAATLALAVPVLAQPDRPEPARVPLSDDAELARVMSLFGSGKYAECVGVLDVLLSPKDPKLEDADVIERARIYYAACLLASGRGRDADEQMRLAIRENPQLQPPDRLTFPKEVVDRFITVREGMLDEIKKAEEERFRKARAAAEAAAKRRAKEKERVKKLEEFAARETEVTKNRRWLAAVPFGVGQFQNDDTALGYLFLGTELALAGTALGALIVELNLNARIDDSDPPKHEELNANLVSAHNVLIFSSWGFLAVALGGIAEAQLSFEPEFRKSKKRRLPPELQSPSSRSSEAFVRPTIVPFRNGAGLGAVGRF